MSMSAVATESEAKKSDKADVKPDAKPDDKAVGIWGGIRIPVIGLTGEKFTGKTLFLASIDPAKTCMIDLEDSSESYNIEFAQRVSLYDEMLKKHKRAATALESFQWFLDFIEEIKPGQFSVLAVDPFTDIQSGLVDWVKANPGKFGHTAVQYEKASGLLWADVKQHCKMMLGVLSRKVETFAFSAHMGNVWKGGAPTDKRKAKGMDTLFELSSLYLELERKPDDKGKVEKKPSGKVIKSRLAISKMVDGELEHFPILPPRLKVATPAAIREYIKNPPDYAKLKKDELVEKEVLSDDDKVILARETAEIQLETEKARLGQMEMLKQQAERQAELRRKQAAAAAAAMKPETVAAAKEDSEETGPTEEAESESAPFDAGEKVESPDPEPTIYEILESQKKQLGITEDQWKSILAKRSVASTKDLSQKQAEEIRLALWDKLTKRDLAGASAKAGPSAKN